MNEEYWQETKTNTSYAKQKNTKVAIFNIIL